MSPAPHASPGHASPGTDDARPRIAVVQAHTLLGEAVVRDALLRAIDVTSITEETRQVARISPVQRILTARPQDEDLFAEAFESLDAVVLPLDREEGEEKGRSGPTALSDLVVTVVRAMRRAGVGRVVAASSLDLTGGAADPVPTGGLRALGRSAGMQRHLLDLRHCEMLLSGSKRDFTVLRAGTLTELLGTRRPLVLPAEEAADVAQTRRIPREDLARALLDAALTPGHEPRVLAVAADG